MLLLRFYPGMTTGKKGNKLKMTMKNRKRNRSMKKIVLTGNFPQNDKQNDLGLGYFLVRKKTALHAFNYF
jgi:hypothetical protein